MLLLITGMVFCQEDDDTIVETGQSGEVGDKLEDQPQVDDLPAWLIDIPPDPEDSVPDIRKPLPTQYIAEDKHVVSTSRMFSVSGGDVLRMGAIASHADDLRKHFNNLLGIKDAWKYSISIRLWGTTADPAKPNPIHTRVRIIGEEPNLQIRIFAGGGIDLPKMDAAIVTMLLYEYALRGIKPNALPDFLELPPWLVTGVQQAMLWRAGQVDRRLYRNLFNKTDMMAPEELLGIPNPRTLDAGSLQMYEVSCGVLIMGLLHQNDGQERLRNLLGEALTIEGEPREMIAAHFHELSVDKTTFSKWWALELAALAMPGSAEMHTPLETEKLLAEALLLTGMEQESRLPFSVSLDKLEEVVKLPDWSRQLRSCMSRLVELNLRAFPGYRSIITEYCRAIAELSRGTPVAEVEKILAPLRELRSAYQEASIRGRDFLDWFEITRLGESQPANFDSYVEAMHILRNDSPGPDTPMSRYLDDIELLHSLSPGDPFPDSLLSKKSTKKK